MVESIYKKFFDSIIEAEKCWQAADHLVYVTMPFVDDQRLILRALESLNKSLVLTISSILKFEYLYKRIELSKSPDRNLEVFFSKCAGKYGLGEDESERIREILFLGKKHKEAGIEFSRAKRVIMLDDNLKTSELSVSRIKEFLRVVREFLHKTEERFKEISENT